MFNENKYNKAEAKLEKTEYNNYKEDKILHNNISNLCKKYIHDIRNMNTLDKEMINNIYYMSNEEKMNIIISFNEIIKYVKETFE